MDKKTFHNHPEETSIVSVKTTVAKVSDSVLQLISMK